MRAFLALPIPEDISARLTALQKDLRFGRLTDPQDFHITLAFLGDRLPDQQVEAAHDALILLRAPAPHLRLEGMATFGGGSVLAALVAPNPALDALHKKVRSLLHGAGLMLPRVHFRPHVTLARFNGPADDTALAAFATRNALFGTAEFAATEMILYRSTLGPKHAIYTALAEYPLH